MRLNQRGVIVKMGAGPRDRQGNRTRVETGRTPVACILQQDNSRELIVNRDTVIDTWRLFLGRGVSIEADDEFEVSGRRYLVDGSPWKVADGTGEEHHVEVHLRYIGEVNTP